MSELSRSDGHGPEWAAAVADIADRAGAAFGGGGCVSVVDLEPWRLLDAWWLRRRLEPLTRLSGRPVRYVPCVGPGPLPRGQHIAAFASPWSAGTAPMQLTWPTRNAEPACKPTGECWRPDGPVIVLAGDLPKRLPQELLLAHHGRIHEWGGPPEAQQWVAMDFDRHPEWIGDSIRAYAKGVPSAMLTLPIGYWRFLEQAFAWASHGCLVLARAEGWSSQASIREHAALGANVRSDSPPVNFHWIGQHAPRIGGAAHMVHASRADAVQIVASRLPDAEHALPILSAALAAATRSPRADRARALRTVAAAGDAEAALAILQLSADDPALLRSAWEALALAAAAAGPEICSRLGAWLERVMADNPWIGDDAALLRGAGHVALACGRVDLAHTALRVLDELGRSAAADLAAFARCLEHLGRFDAALSACERALIRDPALEAARATRERVAQRAAQLAAPWRVQHRNEDSPLMLDPLHADHAAVLVRQMRDPTIPSMTALPALAEGDDGRAWIQARLDEGPATYAIVHRQLGFVGFLQLRVSGTTAFICYWIGVDYQGLGFCTPAIALARELAWRGGIDLLLSSAYEDNARSLRALHKSGFRSMAVRALSPDHERIFIMLPAAPMDEAEGTRRLLEFCDSTQSGLRFAGADGDAAPQASSATPGSDQPA